MKRLKDSNLWKRVESFKQSLIPWLKAKALLLGVAAVWGYLIYTIWQIQTIITLLGFSGNKTLKSWSYNFWIAQDQMVNAFFFGKCDVTISSKVGYMAERGSKTAKAMAAVIDWLFYIAIGQENHCAVSIERDEEHNTWQR